MAPPPDTDGPAELHRRMFSHGKGIPDQLQPDRIELLGIQRFLTDEQQVPGGCIHGTSIGIEQASSVQLLLEMTDIDATGFGTASHVVEKVAAIR